MPYASDAIKAKYQQDYLNLAEQDQHNINLFRGRFGESRYTNENLSTGFGKYIVKGKENDVDASRAFIFGPVTAKYSVGHPAGYKDRSFFEDYIVRALTTKAGFTFNPEDDGNGVFSERVMHMVKEAVRIGEGEAMKDLLNGPCVLWQGNKQATLFEGKEERDTLFNILCDHNSLVAEAVFEYMCSRPEIFDDLVNINKMDDKQKELTLIPAVGLILSKGLKAPKQAIELFEYALKNHIELPYWGKCPPDMADHMKGKIDFDVIVKHPSLYALSRGSGFENFCEMISIKDPVNQAKQALKPRDATTLKLYAHVELSRLLNDPATKRDKKKRDQVDALTKALSEDNGQLGAPEVRAKQSIENLVGALSTLGSDRLKIMPTQMKDQFFETSWLGKLKPKPM